MGHLSLPISSFCLPWRRLELIRSPTCLMVTGGSQGITAGGGINWDSKWLLGFLTESRGKGSVAGGGINWWDSRGLLYPCFRGKGGGGGIRTFGLTLSLSRSLDRGLGNSTSSDLTEGQKVLNQHFRQNKKKDRTGTGVPKERFKGFWYLLVLISLQWRAMGLWRDTSHMSQLGR